MIDPSDSRLHPPQKQYLNPLKNNIHLETALPHGLRPASIDVVHHSQDHLLKNQKSHRCKHMFDKFKNGDSLNSSFFTEEVLESKEIKAFLQEAKVHLKKKYPKFKFSTPMTPQQISDIGDILYGEEYLSDDLFISKNKKFRDKMYLLNEAKHLSKFKNFMMMKTIYSSGLLLHIRSLLQNKVDSLEHPSSQNNMETRMVYYSLHDTVMSPILLIMGVLDHECIEKRAKTLNSSIECRGNGKPRFASNIVIELL